MGVMGVLWCPRWRFVALCGRGWSQSGWSGLTVVEWVEWARRQGPGTEMPRDKEAPERGPGPSAQPPRRPRSSNRAEEQDGAHVCGGGRRGHAGGLLRRGAALLALLPDYWTWRISSSGHSSDQIENMEPVKDRIIKVTFNADVHARLQWNFRPQQTEIYVVPGETALAFYKFKNPTDKPVIGISTYNVVPFEAGQYFNKIQCFCFEEQRLNPQEEVDMPVFFYIDPEFAEDPRMVNVDLITLSYTFFEAKEGHKLPVPGYN